MERFRVTILGCGSALPTMRHLGSSQLLEIRNKVFILDCSEAFQLQLRRCGMNFQRVEHIFISHLHGDHCFGLMGFISTIGLLGRTKPLHIYGPDGISSIFRPQIDFFCPGLEYDVIFHDLNANLHSLIYEDRSLTVHTLPLNHRTSCCGYIFREKVGQRHIISDAIEKYGIPRSQINNIKSGMDLALADGSIIPNDLMTTPPNRVRSYAYCSDTRYKPSLSQYIDGVDALYHEATYCEESKDLAEKYFHSTALEAAQMAKSSHVGKLIIGHYSSRYTDEHVLLDEAQSVFPNTILADELLKINL